jgi:hypothetical protein
MEKGKSRDWRMRARMYERVLCLDENYQFLAYFPKMKRRLIFTRRECRITIKDILGL